MTVTLETGTTRQSVGALLRTWRERRRLSQLELSARTGVSTRHLSYVENGRSRPTPEMVLRLADQLDVPLSETNQLLLAAGFAPRYSARPVDDASLEVVMSGLRHLLDAHLPYPALLLDEAWDVVDANAAVDLLLEGCAPSLLEPPLNALRLSLHPDGLAPRIRNLPEWSAQLIRQVQHRAERTHDPRLHALAEELSTYVGPGALRPEQREPSGPVLALELVAGDVVLRFFSIAARLETATDSTVAGLHLETFLPADEATRAALGDG
jgi:transcriptional regulator with XRE-family HTH domain